MKNLYLMLLLLISASTCSAANLSSQDVRALMVDRTIVGFNEIKSLDYTVYFHPEGRIIFVTAQGKRHGNWRIADDGHFCTVFPTEPELCTMVTPHVEGTYRRIKDDGSPTHTLKKFSAGNVNKY